jgi:hypothetical protein
MPTLTPKQKARLGKLAELSDGGLPILTKHLSELEEENERLEAGLKDAQNAFKTHIETISGMLDQLERNKLNTSEFQAFGNEVKAAVTQIKLMPGPKGERGERGEAGATGDPGRDGRDGREGQSIKGEQGVAGKDGSPDTPDQVADKLNTLEEAVERSVIIGLEDEIKKLRGEIASRSQMTGMRRVPIVRAVELTDQVDGVTTTYTLPFDTVKVLAVFSTQFPVIFDGSADFSFSGRTLTLNTGVVQSGQTLNCLVEVLFYSK